MQNSLSPKSERRRRLRIIMPSYPTFNIYSDIARITTALGLKAIFIGLALAGLATLWMAIAADMGASLLVIFNGLRLLKE